MKKSTYIKAAVIILAAFLFLTSCSTQRRAARLVDRAVKLNPELASEKIDTVFIPELELDTVVQIDTITISQDIDSILNALSDSCKKEVELIVREPLVKYIKERQVITDTLKFTQNLSNDSVELKLVAEIWQDGTEIKLNIKLIDSKIISKTSPIVYEKRPPRIYITVFVVIFIFILVYLILKTLKRWLNL